MHSSLAKAKTVEAAEKTAKDVESIGERLDSIEETQGEILEQINGLIYAIQQAVPNASITPKPTDAKATPKKDR